MTPLWTTQQWEEARRLLEYYDIRTVANMIGRSYASVRYKRYRESKHGAIKLAQRYRPTTTDRFSARPSVEMIAERDRKSAAPISRAAQMLGDPPFGYSALDRKRQQEGANDVR